MKKLSVYVEANEGGDVLFEAVKQRLADLPVNVIKLIKTRGPKA